MNQSFLQFPDPTPPQLAAEGRPLDNRLAAVAAAVRPGRVVADVGADHGHLVCALVGDGTCPRGYASDLRPKPLAAAQAHILRRGLSHKVEAILSDGLTALPGEEIDDVILAGMGGELMGSLITAVDWVRDPDKRLVLQPMTREAHLRRLLYREGFALQREAAVISGKFAYTVMTAAYTANPREVDPLFAHTGLIWGKRDRESLAYLARVRRSLDLRAGAGGREGQAAAALAREIGTYLDMEEAQDVYSR